MQDVFCTTITAFNKPVTVVAVRMKNGFTLMESTACVDPANYSEEIGKQICLEKIEDKVWHLLGYALQDKVHKEKQAILGIPKDLSETSVLMESIDYKQRFRAEYFQLLIRYQKLCKMVEAWDKGQLNFKPTCPRTIYDNQIAAMHDYLTLLQQRAELENVDISSGTV